MLQKLVVALICAVSFVHVHAQDTGDIRVFRAFSPDGVSDIQYVGCAVLRRRLEPSGQADPMGDPYLVVPTPGTSDEPCAQFEWFRDDALGLPKYRILEQSLRRLLGHKFQNDTITIDDDESKTSPEVNFVYENVDTIEGQYSFVRPENSDSVIYVSDNGRINANEVDYKLIVESRALL